MVLNSFRSSNHLFKLGQLLNVNIHHRNESFLGWILLHFPLYKSVVQTSLIERDLRIRLPSLWAGGGGETHGSSHTLVSWRHCNTVGIVTMDWSVRQQGYCQSDYREWFGTLYHGIYNCSAPWWTLAEGQEGSWLLVSLCEGYLFSMCRSVNVVQSTGVTVVGKAAKMRWGCLL